MKTYYLQDNEGYKIAKFEIEDDDDERPVYLEGDVYKAVAWECTDDKEPTDWEYYSGVEIKFDGCSHWWFMGEDYQGKSEEIDAYYHLCGTEYIKEHITVMCFVWEIARQYFKDRYDGVFEDALIKETLKDYKIMEEEK